MKRQARVQDQSAERGGNPEDRDFVMALARGLEVLRAFSSERAALGNGEIAKRTGLPKPTVCRMTHTLTVLGYLDAVPDQDKYRLGTGVLSLGYAALAGLDVRRLARPLLQEVADDANASVALGAGDRDRMVYLELCRGKGPISLRMEVGQGIPILGTAMGRAYLAELGAARRAELLAKIRPADEAAWRKERAAIDEAVDTFKVLGFTTSFGGWHGHIHGVASAFTNPATGQVMAINCGVAAMSISTDELMRIYGPRLAEIARTLEQALSRP